MLHLIAYDIAHDKRLRRVASLCEDHGTRIEKSVFECDLEDDKFNRFWSRMEKIVDPEEDAVFDYPIGLLDSSRVRTLGKACRPRREAYIF